MSNVTLFAFAIVAFIGIATPGPTVLLALTNGSRYGLRRALPGMAGAMISDFVLIGAVALGLGYPIGPLAWGDQLGAATVLTILMNLEQQTGDARYRASPWLQRRALLGLSLHHKEI